MLQWEYEAALAAGLGGLVARLRYFIKDFIIGFILRKTRCSRNVREVI